MLIVLCIDVDTRQAEQIRSIAKSIVPGIVIYAIPEDLQIEKGPDALVEHLVDVLPRLLG